MCICESKLSKHTLVTTIVSISKDHYKEVKFSLLCNSCSLIFLLNMCSVSEVLLEVVISIVESCKLNASCLVDGRSGPIDPVDGSKILGDIY
jgi:hypothetical protein